MDCAICLMFALRSGWGCVIFIILSKLFIHVLAYYLLLISITKLFHFPCPPIFFWPQAFKLNDHFLNFLLKKLIWLFRQSIELIWILTKRKEKNGIFNLIIFNIFHLDLWEKTTKAFAKKKLQKFFK